MSQIDWSLWRSFLAMHRHGSLIGAARAMDVGQPTIRRHLDELETGLGGPLFIRSPAGLVATDLALSMIDAAVAMESAAAELVRTGSARAAAGTVRITASELMGVEILPPILGALKTRHPGLAFELTLTTELESLPRRDVDIAVLKARPRQAGLIATPIGLIPLGLYAHQTWLACHGVPETLTAIIAADSLIGYDRDTSIIRALTEAGFAVKPADFSFRSDHDMAQLAALRAGLGVGVCHRPLAAADPALRHVLPEFNASLETWLVTYPNLRSVARVRATLEGLAAGLAAYIVK